MANEPEKTDKPKGEKTSQDKPKSKVMLLGIISLVIVVGGAGGGLLVAKAAGHAGPEKASAATVDSESSKESSHGGGEKTREPSGSGEDKYIYVELEPVIVNLNEPRLLRYVRATVLLEIESGDKKQVKEVQDLLERRKLVLKNRLTHYLSDHSPDEVRGDKALRHMERQILEDINAELWPNSKGMIHDVLFKEFAVQ